MPEFGALAGVKVLDFSHMIAGPYITLLMAYNGAEILKVESSKRLDGFRRRRGDESIDGSRPFGDFNRNKRDITLNLKTPEARELTKRLAAMCDVVVENFSAKVMSSLGLGYADLVEVRPDIIYASSQGMGQKGPYRDYVSWGPSAMAFSGMSALWNHPGTTEPVGSQTAHPDYITGMYGLLAVMAALHYRARTGRGQYIELAQTEATGCILAPAYLEYSVNGREPRPVGNTSAAAVPHDVYRAAGQDAWLAIAVRTDSEWQAFCAAVGHPEWADDPRFSTLLARLRHREELDQLVGAWTLERSPQDSMALLQAAGVPAAVVENGRDLFEDPHLRARGFITEVDHPEMGRRSYPGIPSRLSETPARVWRHAPLLGQDNKYVFGELLGMPEEEVRRLQEAGVIA